MDAFREFNLYSSRTDTRGIEEPDHAVSACMTKGYFQSYLRLLERRKLKLMQTADAHACSGNVCSENVYSGNMSGVSALKILKDCRYAIKEKSLSESEKKMNFQFKLYGKKKHPELTGGLETRSAGWEKKIFKFGDSETQNSQTSGGNMEPASSGTEKIAFLREDNSNIETILALELQKGMDFRIPFLILDVREESELFGKLGHLENSMNIPLGSLENRIEELVNERDREIIVVCRSGVRASKAAEFLVRKGFKKVKVLKGGMLAWRDLQT